MVQQVPAQDLPYLTDRPALETKVNPVEFSVAMDGEHFNLWTPSCAHHQARQGDNVHWRCAPRLDVKVYRSHKDILRKSFGGESYAATTLIRPAFRERGFCRITISTSWSSAVKRFMRRSTENPASL